MQFDPLFINSNNEEHQKWESIVRGLFNQYKFNFENLGTSLAPQDRHDFPAYTVYPKLKAKTYFGEKKRVHFNRFYTHLGDYTGYPMADNTVAYHHFTLESYHLFWIAPLNMISNAEETFPLVFDTTENFFMEGCNQTFLKDKKYSVPQEYPVYHSNHENYFTKRFFQKNKLSPGLLLNNYDLSKYGVIHPPEDINTLHFALRLFWISVLLLGSMQEIFGPGKKKTDKIRFLEEHWTPQHGKYSSNIDEYRLNVLSFLYLTFHPVATLLCYGLYRDKYGINQGVRTTLYIKSEGKSYAFRDYLKLVIKRYIESINQRALECPQHARELKPAIKSVISLAGMFGIGYSTYSEKKKNIHINSPCNFTPHNLSSHIAGVNYIVEHNPHSPLWRLFYEFGGDWWSANEIKEVAAGEGKHWQRLKGIPRSRFVHYCHTYAALYWEKNVDQLTMPPRAKDIISQNIRNILHYPGRE